MFLCPNTPSCKSGGREQHCKGVACAHPLTISPFDYGPSGRLRGGKITQGNGILYPLWNVLLRLARALVKIFKDAYNQNQVA